MYRFTLGSVSARLTQPTIFTMRCCSVAQAWGFLESWTESDFYGGFYYYPIAQTSWPEPVDFSYTSRESVPTSNVRFRAPDGNGFILHYFTQNMTKGAGEMRQFKAGRFLSVVHAWRLLASWRTDELIHCPISKDCLERVSPMVAMAACALPLDFTKECPELDNNSPYKEFEVPRLGAPANEIVMMTRHRRRSEESDEEPIYGYAREN